MKLFWVTATARINKYLPFLGMLLLLASCATNRPQYGRETGPEAKNDSLITNSKVEHRFYLIGDAGYANEPKAQQMLSNVSYKLKEEGKNATLLYLGDNVYPLGMPADKDHKDRKEAEESLDSQMALAKLFKGKTYFIPGNHDWYHGLKGLEEQDDYVEDKLDEKKAFLPGNGCGIDDIEISDSIVMIAIDSQWFLEDWDRYPTINDDCDIKTRDAMFTELEDILKDSQDKVVVIAMHHPLMTHGTHGGEFSPEKHLFPLRQRIPLPVLGSFIDLARKASGYSTQDIQSRVYNDLSNRVKAMIQGLDNVIVVSGHDHNLQYINHDNIHQVISGAGCKEEAARAIYPNDFSYGGTGYVVMDVFTDGKVKLDYFALRNSKDVKLFERIIDLKPNPVIKDYSGNFPATTKAAIYPSSLTEKGGTYKFLFGDHYRDYYSQLIEVNTVLLDTLYGGLTPVKGGGGHQSKSLRLADKNGKEYVMRGLRKSATQFIQKTAFKNRYIGDKLDNTFAEKFLLDFYTSSHPYASFVVDDLAESAGIYHTNPRLFYVPKQNALKEYNEEYGNELYMIEEHPGKEHGDLASFGKPDDIESTQNVFEDLRKDKKYVIDEKAYIRARLFDMLIGDWDRHSDQWRWSKFEKKDSVVYKPIPRDRDQAFPKYGGALLSIIMRIPALRSMQQYDENIRDIKWFNKSAYPLDVAFIIKSDEDDWLREAKYLQENITDEAIEAAFAELPNEMKDDIAENIKTILKKRRAKLQEFALEYRDVLLKTVIITGTDDKERFVITRLPGGETEVKTYNIEDGAEELLYTQTYSSKKTEEIWIYGLDDDDEFVVKGNGDKLILLRLLGGQNHDIYTVENGRKVKIYDFASKENTFKTDKKAKIILTDDYETNTYNYKKPEYNVFSGYPSAGFNPDDGVKLGAMLSYVVNNFSRDPYSQRHRFKASAYFATMGFELEYRGEFITLGSNWNFAVDARYTSPTFSINYFGYGNTTPNFDEDLGMDYNRVRLQTLRVAPAVFRTSRNGSFLQLQSVFETIEVEDSSQRFVNEPGQVDPSLFEHRQYGGVNVTYSFANYDNITLPALGMAFSFTGGWTTSLEQYRRNFGFAEGFVDFVHKLTPDEKLVFRSRAKVKLRFGNNFEFYQAATLGGDDEVRGYREERFTGKRAAFHSNDIRLTLGYWKNTFVPLTLGIFGGYDYGRVWIPEGNSEKWHQSAGGGIWLNGLNVVTANVFYFRGSDGGRFSFGLTFGF
ncbi:metallophosphoesterase [Flavobacterium coralii]|uniref:metallophosphoesterase n=1 Tax=Flavobacterium coralii TaxID=2838017 RepID=UPI000C4A3581|nr:metallophosphoesterase [Flavobacterium sp.]|tara:strand:+ start:20578 stop:24306 length:3729 start_codon:yes stop_codon:yes gene_type:complete